MNRSKATELSKAVIVIENYYRAKAQNQPYSKLKLEMAEKIIDEILCYVDSKSDDAEREFLFLCFGILDELKEEGDAVKTYCFAEALHRIPFIFCGDEKWNKEFKERHIMPFCRQYGNELFEELLAMEISKNNSKKKSVYRYNEINITSLPAYFCFRMMILLIVLPIILGLMVYFHFSDYTETDHGERYEITVKSIEYEKNDADYLSIQSNEFKESFEATRFFQYSTSPQEFIKFCKEGKKLVVYAEYDTPKNEDPIYEIIQLEDTNGKVYRSYTQTNELDKYKIAFLIVFALIVFVPHFILFVMMLTVALNRKKFVSHPRFVKFCFPDYSLSLNEN